ncbi:MAG: pyridoxamine 5'-phosphate oxidase family protein [Acidimicrobiales bacterium]
MDSRIAQFVERHPDAAMITLRGDGSSHMARIELAVVDGRLWSSGAEDLVRTRNLRCDRRCSLFVFGPHPDWVGLETEVNLLDGVDSPQLHVKLMNERHKGLAPEGMVMGHDDRIGGDRLYSMDEYTRHIACEKRLIYDFEVKRAYGNF